MAIAILCVLALVALMLAFVAFRVVKDAPSRTELARLQAIESYLQNATAELQQKAAQVEGLLAEKARLEADLANERRASGEKLKLLEDSEGRLKTEFENLANRIFEDKGELLSDQNRERLTSLLQPFKEQLESFRTRVDEVHKDDTRASATLLEQVRQLQETSNRVSDDANNLAKAIRGDSKKLGDWGELIVERVFEASGLSLGREYSKQENLRDEAGALRKPDFVVYLPGNRAVVVDSKVSLADYERFAKTDNTIEQQAALTAHVEAVRKHIRELSEKNYSHLLGNRALDFVIMCIPLEPAYLLAMQADRDLVYDLAKMKVVVTGSNMLMMTLKVIAQIWRRENENRNAEQIAIRAGRLYDQVVLIVQAMLEAKKHLGDVSESFDLALRRLKDGKGNLVGRVEEIRGLGAKVSKQLPAAILVDAKSGEPDDSTARVEALPAGDTEVSPD
jgi:DNA recombination protein RmuC